MTATAVPSSSSLAYNWTHDVFLSFRGEDTRLGFTGNLYNALCQRGIRTFIDDESLRRGEEITPALHKAIEQSRIAVVVFSKNYASSTFCLNELVTILECVQGKGRWVWPIFYDLDPSEVRHQKGSYGESLAKHEGKFQYSKEIIQHWKLGLCQAANLSGWHFKHGLDYEYAFIEKIVKEVSSKLDRIPLHIAKFPVGLETRVLEIKSLIDVGFDDRVRMVGILGIGGIGKSVLARAVYNLIADQFEGLCYLPNVRESSSKLGLEKLQETLLSELVQEKDIELRDINHGISILERRLQGKKVLIILDDVDKNEQLQALAGEEDWFGFGSTIIITTRDKHLLDLHGVERKYEVKELDHKEALELFCWNAFKSNEVHQKYMGVSKGVVNYAQGLPLVLEVMGSNLFGKSVNECKSALDIYRNIPIGKVQDILKVSYDGLEKKEQDIFLDIACFFKGHELEYVQDMMQHARDFNSQYGVGVLIDKSLIQIVKSRVEMHDLVQDMGKEIVRQQSPEEPGKRSRLWCSDDIIHVLEENTGTDKIEVIILDLSKEEEVHWNGKAFKKMKNLRTLIVRNACFSQVPKHLPSSLRVLEWWRYPLPCFPDEFRPRKLAILELPNSCFVSLEPLKKTENLSVLNFDCSEFIAQIPDVSGIPNLTKLSVSACKNLVEIHSSVGFLDKLKVLHAEGCHKLRNFPRRVRMPALEHLGLSFCSNLESFPQILQKMRHMKELKLSGTAIKEFPFSIINLTQLEQLHIYHCGRFQLPSSILMLPALKQIYVWDCAELCVSEEEEDKSDQEKVSSIVPSKLERIELKNSFISDESLAICLTWFANVKYIYLCSTNFQILPACINDCHSLIEVYLEGCKHVREIRGIPPNIQKFFAPNCTSLTSKSTSMLLLQVLHKVRGKKLCAPGARIPEWFVYSNKGASISFWFRNKFPAIVLSLVYGPVAGNSYRSLICSNLIINGKFCEGVPQLDHFFTETDNVLVFDLQGIEFDDRAKGFFVENKWNHVEVLYDSFNAIVKECGIRVLQQQSSMNDIRFTNPYQ